MAINGNVGFNNYGYDQTILSKKIVARSESLEKNFVDNAENREMASRSMKNLRDIFTSEQCLRSDIKKDDEQNTAVIIYYIL